MTARGSVLVLVCAVAALLALPTAGVGATAKAQEQKIGSIELEGSNGYEIEVTTIQSGKRSSFVAISAANGPLRANYDVRAEGVPGIHAVFGSLGQADLSFQRQKKVVTHPEPHCPWVSEKGVFRGSFRFTGEGGYTTVEAVDPPGTMLRLPHGFCGLRDDRRARPFLGLTARVLQAESNQEGRVISFEASQEEFVHRPSFHASLFERVEEMNILRSARAPGKKGAFTSTGTSRGSVRPPAPFVGSAAFLDLHPAAEPATWTGSLMVSFPGAPEVPLAGETFAANLCPRISILSNCLKRR
jgi:hypothetical protein